MSDLKPIGQKSPLNLIPRNALCAIAGVMEHGNQKYAPWNFVDCNQPQAEIAELQAALLRHTLASSDPTESDYDDESGIHHLAHAGACVLILLVKLGLGYEPSLFVKYPELVEMSAAERADFLADLKGT